MVLYAVFDGSGARFLGKTALFHFQAQMGYIDQVSQFLTIYLVRQVSTSGL